MNNYIKTPSQTTVESGKAKTQKTNTKIIAFSALLSAIGILIPLVVPKIIIVPQVMTVTIGSHVAVMLAMFISPFSAVMVALTTTIGFLITTTPVVALRALSHIFFAILGSFLAKRFIKRFSTAMILNVLLALVHAAAEVLTVYACMFIFKDLFPAIDNLAFYLGVLVFLITIAHSIVDFMLAYSVYLPLKKNRLLD